MNLGRIILQSGGIVSGREVDGATGQPIFGARVTIVQGSSRFLKANAGAPSGARSGRKPTQTTDSNGTFSFSGLKGGSLTLRVKHTDYVEAKATANPDVVAESRELVIELTRGGEITGTVFGPGEQPRRNMQIYLIGDDPRSNKRARSGRDGQFTFRSVVPGSYTVKALEFAQEGRPVEEVEVRVDIGPGQTRTVVLQLP